MSCYRVDVFTAEPLSVLNWIEANIPTPRVVRAVGYKVEADGWVMKCVFKYQEDAETFHRHWRPEATDHSVSPWK